MGVSVTKRIQEIVQPRGGYINPKEMEIIQLPIINELKAENFASNLVGLVV